MHLLKNHNRLYFFCSFARIFRNKYYICPWLSRSSGLGGSRHFGFRALNAHCSPQTSRQQRVRQGAGKDVFRTLSSTHRTSQLWFRRKISQRGVRAGCIIPVCHWCSLFRRTFVWYTSFIIRDWRGLAELLISTERQCEGQISGMSKEVSPTFFYICRGNGENIKEKRFYNSYHV